MACHYLDLKNHICAAGHPVLLHVNYFDLPDVKLAVFFSSQSAFELCFINSAQLLRCTIIFLNLQCDSPPPTLMNTRAGLISIHQPPVSPGTSRNV